jgi:hypothetical protein
VRTIALLGAGFSRNWGGWLANEAFEYLIGVPALRRRPSIIRLLWQHQDRGGFEGALDELQQRSGSGDTSATTELRLLHDAVREMFGSMNGAFFAKDFHFSDEARTFLARFDAIFTLNQDLLLERHYIHSGRIAQADERKRWSGATLPGVHSPFTDLDHSPTRWSNERWRISDVIPTLGVKAQPVFKLHGSAQWYRDVDQDGLMVLGGGKSAAIRKDKLLRWYWDQFRAELAKPGTRLMIIGYGFMDGHVNEVIKEAGTNSVKMYVIDPRGADVWREANEGPLKGQNHIQPYLMGASRRDLQQIVRPVSVEYAKVMRFFEDD